MRRECAAAPRSILAIALAEVRRAGEGLLAFAAPPGCASCDEGPVEGVGDLCPACEKSLPAFPPGSCTGCGGVPGTGPHDCCRRCRSRFRRDGLVALAPFEGNVREMIHAFKYGANFNAGKCLARRLAEKVAVELAGCCDVIVPVPLHFRRLRSRGFNQAALLARGVSAKTGWPLATCVLKRRTDSRALAGLGVPERKKEVRGSVIVRRKSPIEGMRVLLVDDVFTSGATAEECCRVLKESGCLEVYVAAVGRA